MTARNDVFEYVSADSYPISVRAYRNPSASTAVVMLHGVVSHSEWLAPVAERLVAGGVDAFCPDRRGAGLNDLQPGDAPGAAELVSDTGTLLEQLSQDYENIHLCGFCWGGSYAIHCAEKYENEISSLILLAPSVFPAASLADTELVTGDSETATETPIVPVELFTRSDAYRDYILPDPIQTRRVSPRFNRIMADMTSMLAIRWMRLRIPTLMVLASDDRISDNAKHVAAFERLRTPESKKTHRSGLARSTVRCTGRDGGSHARLDELTGVTFRTVTQYIYTDHNCPQYALRPPSGS